MYSSETDEYLEIAIVDMVVNDGQLIILTKAAEDEALCLNAGALADQLVVFTQPTVERCAIK